MDGIASVLRFYREDVLRLQRNEMALRLGVSPSQYGKIEKGESALMDEIIARTRAAFPKSGLWERLSALKLAQYRADMGFKPNEREKSAEELQALLAALDEKGKELEELRAEAVRRLTAQEITNGET